MVPAGVGTVAARESGARRCCGRRAGGAVGRFTSGIGSVAARELGGGGETGYSPPPPAQKSRSVVCARRYTDAYHNIIISIPVVERNFNPSSYGLTPPSRVVESVSRADAHDEARSC